MRHFKPLLALLTFSILYPSALFGDQPISATGAKLSPAVIAIEIDVKRFLNSATLKATKLQLDKIAPYAATAQMTIDDIDNVSAVMSVPESLDGIGGDLSGKKAPFSLKVKIQLTDSALATKLFDKMTEEMDKVTIGGLVYFQNTNGSSGAANFVMHMPSADTIVLGTDDYVQAGDVNLLSVNLAQKWRKVPNQTVRIALDLSGMSNFLQQSQEKNAADPNQAMLFSFLGNLDAFRLAMDLESDPVLSLVLTGKDEQATATTQAQLDGILVMAKTQGKKSLGQLPPKAQPAVSALLDALKTQRNGNDISLILPRPVGFEDAAAVLAKQFAPARLFAK